MINMMTKEDLSNLRKKVAEVDGKKTVLRTQDFDFSENTTDEKSEVARIQAPRDLQIRNGRFPVVIPAYETFSTDGSADNSETFSLSHDLEDSENGVSIVVYDDGSLVSQSDLTVDYSADSFDYSSPNTNSTLDVYYVAKDPARIEIYKEAPKSGGNVEEKIYEGDLNLIHQTDQNRDPEKFYLNNKPFEAVVPENFNIVVYVDAPYTIAYSESTRGTKAINRKHKIPIEQFNRSIDGLGKAVKLSSI